jgi:hypothetical protein
MVFDHVTPIYRVTLPAAGRGGWVAGWPGAAAGRPGAAAGCGGWVAGCRFGRSVRQFRPAVVSPDGHDRSFSPAGDIFCPFCHSSGVDGG